MPPAMMASRWPFWNAQYRAVGRLEQPTRVGVPAALGRVAVSLARVLGKDQVGLRFVAVLFLGGGMIIQWAELGGEGDLLLAGYVLVTEEKHLVLEQQGVDFVALRWGERLAQVHAADFGADGGLQWGDIEWFGKRDNVFCRHVAVLLWVTSRRKGVRNRRRR